MKTLMEYSAIAILLVAAIVLSRIGGELVSVRAQATPAYSISYHIVGTDGSGDIREADQFNGQDGSGNQVQTATLPGFRRKIKFNPVGITVDINGGNGITTWGTGIPRAYEPPPANCRDGDQQPIQPSDKKVILGFEVFRNYRAYPGSYIQEEWRAPALDCQPLWKRTDFFKDSTEPNVGAPDGYTIEYAVSASAGEPDKALFAVPENPVEMSPDEYWQSIGKTRPNAHDAKVRQMTTAIYNEQESLRQQNLGLRLLKKWYVLAQQAIKKNSKL